MFASVLRLNKSQEAPRLYGPFYMIEGAFDAANPTGVGELIIYDLSRPVGDTFEVAGRVFTSGRRFTKQEYYERSSDRLSQRA